MRHSVLTAIALLAVGCGKSNPPAAPVVTDGNRAMAKESADKYVIALVAGQFDDAYRFHDAAMTKAMPTSMLVSTWEGLKVKHGNASNPGTPTVTDEGGYLVAVYPIAFGQELMGVRIVVDGSGKVSGLWIKPHVDAAAKPADDDDAVEANLPEGVVSRKVTTGAEGWPLPARVTLPSGPGPFPAVVLVHGSGPHDLDETVGPNKPFRDLAHGLAARGIASIRYEKRTKAHAQKLAANMAFTIDDESVNDAVAAVATLEKLPEIKKGHVFVLGHSLGGMVAPRIAKKALSLKGLVVMAGNTRKLEKAIVDQLDYLAKLPDAPIPAAQVEAMKKEAALVKKIGPPSDADSKTLIFGIPATYWRDLNSYDPAAVAKTLKLPMLFLQGDRDYQVTSVDLDGWKAALSARKDVMFRTYPSLNHLFLEGTGPSHPREYDVAGHIPSFVLDDIASFIKRNSM